MDEQPWWNLFAGVPIGFQVLFWIVFVITTTSFISVITLTIAGARERRNPPSGGVGEDHFLWVFLVPALNEEVTIADSVARLRSVRVTNGLIVVINDGSDDRTGEILAGLAGDDLLVLTRRPPDARLGKAAGLNHAYRLLVDSVFLHPLFEAWKPSRVIVAVVDADGRLDPVAASAVATRFADPMVGGVQTRVRIYNRQRPLTWAQDTEFAASAFVYQAGRSSWGTANMGGNGQFNRLSALQEVATEVGPWRDRLTEDQDLGIRLIQQGWRGGQENRVSVHQQGVSSLGRLYRQRIRWAQGTWQAVGLLGGVGRMTTGAVGRIDAAYYLVTPILQLITGLDLIATILLWAFVGIPLVPGLVLVGLIFITLGFGPGFISLVLTRRGIRGVLFAIVTVIPYTLYSWLVYPSLLIGLIRQLGGRTSWAKTAREPLADAPAAM